LFRLLLELVSTGCGLNFPLALLVSPTLRRFLLLEVDVSTGWGANFRVVFVEVSMGWGANLRCIFEVVSMGSAANFRVVLADVSTGSGANLRDDFEPVSTGSTLKRLTGGGEDMVRAPATSLEDE